MSWIIVRLATGEAVLETYSKELAASINTANYQAIPAREYLEQLSRRIKTECAA